MIGDKFVKAHVITIDRPFFYEKVEGTITFLENTALVGIHLACLDDATIAVLIEDVSLTWDNEHL